MRSIAAIFLISMVFYSWPQWSIGQTLANCIRAVSEGHPGFVTYLHEIRGLKLRHKDCLRIVDPRYSPDKLNFPPLFPKCVEMSDRMLNTAERLNSRADLKNSLSEIEGRIRNKQMGRHPIDELVSIFTGEISTSSMAYNELASMISSGDPGLVSDVIGGSKLISNRSCLKFCDISRSDNCAGARNAMQRICGSTQAFLGSLRDHVQMLKRCIPVANSLKPGALK